MGKLRGETTRLRQLEQVQILWPGDVRALAEFVLRTYDAKDRIVNASPSGGLQISRPTLHGLAMYLAPITGMARSQIEDRLREHGLRLESTVEYDPPPSPDPRP